MNLLEKLEGMSDSCRVWVYQSERFFQDHEKAFLDASLQKFMKEWAAHGAALAANFDLIGGLFIVLVVDESQVAASGCSIDSSTRFIKSLESELGYSLTNRLNVACFIEEELKIFPLKKLKEAIQKKLLKPSDMYFDNAITHLGKLRSEWMKPMSSGWVAKFFEQMEMQS